VRLSDIRPLNYELERANASNSTRVRFRQPWLFKVPWNSGMSEVIRLFFARVARKARNCCHLRAAANFYYRRCSILLFIITNTC
jgi:hypothetical protein